MLLSKISFFTDFFRKRQVLLDEPQEAHFTAVVRRGPFNSHFPFGLRDLYGASGQRLGSDLYSYVAFEIHFETRIQELRDSVPPQPRIRLHTCKSRKVLSVRARGFRFIGGGAG